MYIEKYNEMKIQRVLEGLRKRNMTGYFCKSADEIIETVGKIIEGEKTVCCGGSLTLKETGVVDMLNSWENIHVIDKSKAKDKEEEAKLFRDAFSCDVYFMSTNAITEDGIMVNIDGRGNRVAAMIFGPKKVVIIAGVNKICPTLDDAMVRARNYAAPVNCMRLDKKTPCAGTGVCHDCMSDDGICNQFVVTRRSGDKDRIHVIITDQEYGY